MNGAAVRQQKDSATHLHKQTNHHDGIGEEANTLATDDTTVSDSCTQLSEIDVKAIDIDGLTGIEYEKIIHSVNFEGMIIETNIQDDDEYINEEAIAQGPPIMYTEDEDALAMDELNDSFFIPTPKTTRHRNKDIAPICIVKIKYIGGVQLD